MQGKDIVYLAARCFQPRPCTRAFVRLIVYGLQTLFY